MRTKNGRIKVLKNTNMRGRKDNKLSYCKDILSFRIYDTYIVIKKYVYLGNVAARIQFFLRV